MKKKLFIALALVIVCTVAALALALAQPPASSSAAEPGEQVPGSPADPPGADPVEATPAATVSYQGKAIPLTQDFSLLAEDAFLQEKEWEIEPWPERATNEMVDAEAAWEAATQDLDVIGAEEAIPESVNIVLVKFSDPNMQVIPGTDIPLTEIPVWLVTVKGFDCLRTGSTTETFVTKTNLYYAIDAYSGGILEIIGQGVGE